MLQKKEKKIIEKILIEHANNKKSNNQISNNNLISMETELDFIMRDIFTINRKIPKYEEKKELLKETSDKLNELSELYKKMLPLQSSLIRQAGNKLFIKNVQNKLKPLYSDKDKLIKNILRNKVIIRRIDERLYKYNDADYNPDSESNVQNINNINISGSNNNSNISRINMLSRVIKKSNNLFGNNM